MQILYIFQGVLGPQASGSGKEIGDKEGDHDTIVKVTKMQRVNGMTDPDFLLDCGRSAHLCFADLVRRTIVLVFARGGCADQIAS